MGGLIPRKAEFDFVPVLFRFRSKTGRPAIIVAIMAAIKIS